MYTSYISCDKHNTIPIRSIAVIVSSLCDLQTFYLDVREIDWDAYALKGVIGVKKFLLKEDVHNLEKARMHMKRLVN